MRELPSELAASLASGVTTLCQCWVLTRRDGWEIAVTDHDQDIVIGARTFEANGGFEASAVEADAGLATGGGEISGALSSAEIYPRDIEAGRFDGAEIRTYLVDWQAPALDFLIDVSTIGEIRRSDGQFVAELRNAFHRWDEEQGRLYSASCNAEFGDARCGVDILQPPFRLMGQIDSVASPERFTSSEIANAAIGLFTRGHVRFTSGANDGIVATIKEQRSGGELVLWQSLVGESLAGDTFEAIAGCDKRFPTCRDRFANASRFRGFPFIPAPEFILAYARPGEGRHRGRPLVR